MHKISIGTLKGGVGKSTTAATIASILALEHNKKVLIIDTDPQGNTTSLFQLDEIQENYKSIKDVFENININPKEVICETGFDNLHIIGSTIFLTATEMKLVPETAREFCLKRYFKKNKRFFDKYDYIIFDTNPSMSVINQNVFSIADSIILISETGIGSYKGIELFDFLWGSISDKLGLDKNIKALLVNRANKQTVMYKDYINFLENNDLTKDILLKNTISESIKFKEAEINNSTINTFDGNSKYSVEFCSVVNELLERSLI
ncbi:ParA family protein (plasmid) [Clostridium botulinum]|uniref:AAA domain-containing protein n=1 Tax=Clostridium botulinum C/D str. DC5 TaxID=1443128 RepID=A0A0A0HY00_CLOBO|nr:ParA family protein [Clostridium botulinum]KEI00030.1 hypothetical protein Z952_14500 [Clostridium botulinum C/D str. BKT75002]KEI05814.1 hypothetical protein Z954_14655 [Clostridium botulinum C/D str. BKT2873]KGM92961.1 hypothetical protein Z955_16410 [Clostridium botulinum C/D str. DC5]KOC45932.1 hypothetical protein ADU88_12920 [Clostridium botulinum]KOC50802.1 hypothetical protein ADU89_14310 [Clostridium botulinum]